MAHIKNRIKFRMILQALPKEVRKEVRTGVLEAAGLVLGDQKELCPVLTGALRASGKVTPGDEDLPDYASLKGSRVAADPELAAIITFGNSAVRYAHLVEFGTQSARAQPFFYPGYRARRKDAQRRINKAARDGIKKGFQ